jgi:hypothetical protein
MKVALELLAAISRPLRNSYEHSTVLIDGEHISWSSSSGDGLERWYENLFRKTFASMSSKTRSHGITESNEAMESDNQRAGEEWRTSGVTSRKGSNEGVIVGVAIVSELKYL